MFKDWIRINGTVFRQPASLGSLKTAWVLGLLAASTFAQASEIAAYRATVIAVHDGDSIRVQDEYGRQRRIRLAYIDAPELNQAGGQESKKALSQLLLRQKVHVTVWDIDRYRREVAQVTLGGQDINATQVQNGHAWHYRSIARKYQNRMDYAQYAQSEASAKQEQLGLWHQKQPQSPWAFRYQQGKMTDGKP